MKMVVKKIVVEKSIKTYLNGEFLLCKSNNFLRVLRNKRFYNNPNLNIIFDFYEKSHRAI